MINKWVQRLRHCVHKAHKPSLTLRVGPTGASSKRIKSTEQIPIRLSLFLFLAFLSYPPRSRTHPLATCPPLLGSDSGSGTSHVALFSAPSPTHPTHRAHALFFHSLPKFSVSSLCSSLRREREEGTFESSTDWAYRRSCHGNGYLLLHHFLLFLLFWVFFCSVLFLLRTLLPVVFFFFGLAVHFEASRIFFRFCVFWCSFFSGNIVLRCWKRICGIWSFCVSIIASNFKNKKYNNISLFLILKFTQLM